MLLAAALIVLLAASSLAGAVLFFYRDPERKVLKADNALLSPVDGRVVAVRRYSAFKAPVLSKDGRSFRLDELAHTDLLGSNGTIISIAISPLDIHTVRSPADSKVVQISSIHGGLKLMRNPEFEYTNERVSMVLETASGKVGLVIVAAPITSSVRVLVGDNDYSAAGERVARIRLGSLASLIIPDDCGFRPVVSCGERVLAGLTVIAQLGKTDIPINECYAVRRSTVPERFYLPFLLGFVVLERIFRAVKQVFRKDVSFKAVR
ncbi:MAG: phosphatidylserine decarboxylase [Candidatus Caldarchaeum sp.]|nr:phosphatidylserine decarboxylase [Candidatus Caldarchaeum sp.]